MRLAVVLIALCFTGFAQAGLLTLQHGTHLQGDFVSTNERVLVFHAFGEEEARTFARDQVTAESWYAAREATIAGDDWEAHLALAEFCMQNKLYHPASAQLHRILKGAPDLASNAKADLAKIDEMQAQSYLETAKHAHATKHLTLANRMLAKVLTQYPDSKAAAEAKTLHATVDKEVAAHKRTRRQIWPEPGPGESKWEKTHFEHIRKLMDKGADRNSDGLKADQSKSIKDFKVGISDYRHAVGKLDAMLKDANTRKDAITHAQKMREEAQKDVVELYLNLAHVYAGRSSYIDAQHVLNEGMTVAPDDPDLKEYREQVQQMQAASSGNWRRGGRRR